TPARPRTALQVRSPAWPAATTLPAPIRTVAWTQRRRPLSSGACSACCGLPQAAMGRHGLPRTRRSLLSGSSGYWPQTRSACLMLRAKRSSCLGLPWPSAGRRPRARPWCCCCSCCSRRAARGWRCGTCATSRWRAPLAIRRSRPRWLLDTRASCASSTCVCSSFSACCLQAMRARTACAWTLPWRLPCATCSICSSSLAPFRTWRRACFTYCFSAMPTPYLLLLPPPPRPLPTGPRGTSRTPLSWCLLRAKPWPPSSLRESTPPAHLQALYPTPAAAAAASLTPAPAGRAGPAPRCGLRRQRCPCSSSRMRTRTRCASSTWPTLPALTPPLPLPPAPGQRLPLAQPRTTSLPSWTTLTRSWTLPWAA
ncbi:hypothetical protein IWQ56_003524, partial [Coemansia nantahalensis]